MKSTKKELLPVLNKHLAGTKRVPVLLFQNPLASLHDYGIDKYEMSMVEPMHDIAEHFQSLRLRLEIHLVISLLDQILIYSMIQY